MTGADLVPHLPWIIAGGIIIGFSAVWGWVYTTRLRIKHGYPLEGMWGQSLKPSVPSEAMERIRLLSQENAQLRAELSSMKDRMATVERIVTDSGFQLNHEIEKLRGIAAN